MRTLPSSFRSKRCAVATPPDFPSHVVCSEVPLSDLSECVGVDLTGLGVVSHAQAVDQSPYGVWICCLVPLKEPLLRMTTRSLELGLQACCTHVPEGPDQKPNKDCQEDKSNKHSAHYERWRRH